jgi:hypothetical protein
LKQHIYYIAAKDPNARKIKKEASPEEYEKIIAKMYQAVAVSQSSALRLRNEIGEKFVYTPFACWFKPATPSVMQEQTSWLMNEAQQNVSFRLDNCFSLQSTISEGSSAEMYFNFWKHAITDEQKEAIGQSYLLCTTLLGLQQTNHITTLTLMMQDDFDEGEDTELLCEQLFSYSQSRLLDQPLLKNLYSKEETVIKWLEECQSMMLRSWVHPKCGPKVTFKCLNYTSKLVYTSSNLFHQVPL